MDNLTEIVQRAEKRTCRTTPPEVEHLLTFEVHGVQLSILNSCGICFRIEDGHGNLVHLSPEQILRVSERVNCYFREGE